MLGAQNTMCVTAFMRVSAGLGSACFTRGMIFQLLVENGHNANTKKIGGTSLKLRSCQWKSNGNSSVWSIVCFFYILCERDSFFSETRVCSRGQGTSFETGSFVLLCNQYCLWISWTWLHLFKGKKKKRNYKHIHLRISGNYPNAQILPGGNGFQ